MVIYNKLYRFYNYVLISEENIFIIPSMLKEIELKIIVVNFKKCQLLSINFLFHKIIIQKLIIFINLNLEIICFQTKKLHRSK